MELQKYPKIKALGSQETVGVLDGMVVIQSKVDGANFRFKIEDSKLVIGSRNNIMNNVTADSKWKAVAPVMKAFKQYPEKFNPSYQYYGESMQRHSISYDNIPGFVGFDIFNEETEMFLHWKEAKKEFESLGLEFVNVHFEKPGNEITTDDLYECIKNSPYRDGADEGVTIKNVERLSKYGTPLYGKLVTDSFKEQNRKTFGAGQPKKDKSSSILITEIYCTDARIEKVIHKLVNEESMTLDMGMMPSLFSAVVEDILVENILDISKSFKDVHFKDLGGNVARKCVPILKRMMLDVVL